LLKDGLLFQREKKRLDLGEDVFGEWVGVDVFVAGKELLESSESYSDFEPAIAGLQVCFCEIIEILHHFINYGWPGGKVEASENGLFHQ
jgi:hypothetical protein